MPIVLRNSKNSALTHSELDGNFTDLDTRVNSKADSSTITSIVNAEYIQARQLDLQRDSAFITNIVSETYVTNFIDSAYIQARQVDLDTQRDSAFVTNIVTTAYIQDRQNTYTDISVNNHLNTGTATSGQVLSWTGADYDWVAQTGVGLTEATSVAFTVHNSSGATLTKGEVVYISGLNGNTPEISKAQANSSTTMPAFGIVKEDIANSADGTVITFGSCPGHDVADFGETGITFALGDTLYVSATEAGKLTNVAPAGESNLIQNIGKIERASPTTNMTLKIGGAGRTNATPNLDDGNIFIGNAQNRSATMSFATAMSTYSEIGLNDLTDVNTLDYTSPPDRSGQPLVWDNVDSVWYPGNGLSLTGILHMEDNSFINLRENAYLHFEGSVTDGFDTILNVINPTANRTVRLPDASGTVALTSDIPVAYTNADVDTHLNVSGATSGQILSWNGSDYAWVADQTGGGGGSGLDSAGIASYLNGGWNFHLIPDTNATYDIGSAEYKVRHLYLSDNSLYFDSGQTSIGFETVGTSKNLKFNNNVVKEASHADEAGGPVDISKTNHFVTTGATYDLPNGEYVGQELKFWHKTQGGTNIVRVNVLNAKWRNGGGVLSIIPNMLWDQDKENTACYGCIWDGEAWIIGEGSLGA